MKERIVGESILAGRWAYRLLLGVLLICFYVVLKNLRIEPYLALPGFLFLCLLFITILFSMYCLVVKNKVIFTNKRLRVQNQFRKRSYLNKDIEGYKIRRYSSKDFKGEQIILKIGRRFVAIDSNYYAKYGLIKRFVEQRFQQLPDRAFNRFYFLLTLPRRIIFLSIALFFLFLSYDRQPLKAGQLVNETGYIDLELATAPRLESRTKRKPRGEIYHYELDFKGHAEYNFYIKGKAYDLCKKEGILALVAGDKIKVGVEKPDLLSKVQGTERPDFWTKHFGWAEIPIYHIAFGDEVLLDVQDLDIAMATKQNISWLWILFSLFFIALIFPKDWYAQ